MSFKLKNQTCLNCGERLIDKFCSHCGQKSNIDRITFKETFDHFLSAAFSFEGPFLTTIKWLIINPGKIFREYLAGKRKKYYKPIAFFILLTAIYIILKKLIDYDPLEGQIQKVNSARIADLQRKIIGAARFMINNIDKIMLTLIFSNGLMLKLFFRKKYYFAEYLAISFYIAGVYIFVTIPIMIINKYLGFHLNQVQLLILVGYIFYCIQSFFAKKNSLYFLKYAAVSFFSVLLYIVLGFGFSFLIN